MSPVSLTLRPATTADRRLLWEWANDPGVRRAAFNQASIPWTDHVRWFDQRIGSATTTIYIFETGDHRPVGQARFELTSTGEAEVDVSIAGEWRGQGLGARILGLACNELRSRFGSRVVIAQVKPDNLASIRAFERAGFTRADRDGVTRQDAVRMELVLAPGAGTFVVGAARAWNRSIFDDRIARLPGRWSFAAEPADLTLVQLNAVRPRYVFLLHWPWKVPPEIVQTYECVGFHMTDLPYGRGGSPLQNLIVRGHKTTMLTAFRLTDEMDAGPVYMKAPLALDGTAEEIYIRASNLAAELIGRILHEAPAPIPQSGEPVVFRRRTPAESRLPEGATPAELYDFIRMLDADGYPRAFVDHGRWRCEFSRATLEDGVLRADVRFVAIASQNG